MELNQKLRELRLARNLTQENVAEYLKVSSQTVSKWERGLLSPDISLLPKIALLYRCSIDTLFDMDTVWGEEHRNEFKEKLQLLRTQNDWEGIYQAWLYEIELHPDRFSDYPKIMGHVLRKRLLDDEHINNLLSFSNYAERNCMDDEIRNEIFRLMLEICAESAAPHIKEKAQYYYQKLPLLKHSREVYCRHVLSDEQYYAQIKQNIFYSIDICECAVRQLVTDDMSAEEQLYYYKKAAELYEIVLDHQHGGFYDIPLLGDYYKIVELLIETGDSVQAEMYIDRIISIFELRLSEDKKEKTSVFLPQYALSDHIIRIEKSCEMLFHTMLQNEKFTLFHEKIYQLSQRYSAYLNSKRYSSS